MPANALTFPPDITWADSVFDGMMTSGAAVYKQIDTFDGFNNIVSDYVQIPTVTIVNGVTKTVDLVPCLVRNLKGEELNTPPAPQSQTSHGIQEFLIFMRLIRVDNPPVDLNIKHWLQILSRNQIANGESLLDPNDANAGAVLYNITSISNPALLDHHLEVSATVITP